MLSYSEFKEAFEEMFLETASEDERSRIKFSVVSKINEKLDSVGICGDMGMYQGGPCLYINDIYRHYQTSGSVVEEVDGVWQTFRRMQERNFELPEFSWDYVKKNIAFQLIRREGNEQYLEGVPYRRYLDLAVIYRCFLKRSGDSTTSCVITKGLMKSIDVSEEELYEAAYQMTPIVLVPRAYTMREMIQDMVLRLPAEERHSMEASLGTLSDDMWVVTNAVKQMGAYLLLYPDFFRSLTENGGDMFIIPSSIHELIVLPVTEEVQSDALTAMIHEVNENEVAQDERLSDSLYRYNASENLIEIV